MQLTTLVWAFITFLLSKILPVTALFYREESSVPLPFSDFSNNVVFKPGPDYTSWGTIYGRSLQLLDGSHLVTWENYPPEPPLATFPLWKSETGGASWYSLVNVTDQINGWGLRYQPHLYLLGEDLGEYKAGTIILSGMSVPADLSEAWLDIYTSTDNGLTWEFASHVAYAPGPETTTNGNKAVWEPFFLMHKGQLICYYSDQRDKNHAQKLVHVVTSDLKTWSEPVDDVAESSYGWRPGMTTVAHIKSTDKYIMTYEICNMGESGCPCHYKVASSPLEFASVEGVKIYSNSSGVNPGSAPFVTWTPKRDSKDGSGLIIMNAAQDNALFVNEDSASPDGWKRVNVEQQSAHSRCIEIIDVKGNKKLMLTGAGHMQSGADNYVSVAVMDIPT